MIFITLLLLGVGTVGYGISIRSRPIVSSTTPTSGTLLLIQRPSGPPIYLFWPRRLSRHQRRVTGATIIIAAFPAWSPSEHRRWARLLSAFPARWAWLLPEAWIELRPINAWSGAIIRTIHEDSPRLQALIARVPTNVFDDLDPQG